MKQIFSIHLINAIVAIALGIIPACGQEMDQKLSVFYQNYLETQFHQQPFEATQLGDHRFDARLDDISPQARAGWRTLAQRTLDDLPGQVNYSKLSRDGQIDYEIFQNDLRHQLWLDDNTASSPRRKNH